MSPNKDTKKKNNQPELLFILSSLTIKTYSVKSVLKDRVYILLWWPSLLKNRSDETNIQLFQDYYKKTSIINVTIMCGVQWLFSILTLFYPQEKTHVNPIKLVYWFKDAL